MSSALQSPIGISLQLFGLGLAIMLSVVYTAPKTHLVPLIAGGIELAAFSVTGVFVAGIMKTESNIIAAVLHTRSKFSSPM